MKNSGIIVSTKSDSIRRRLRGLLVALLAGLYQEARVSLAVRMSTLEEVFVLVP